MEPQTPVKPTTLEIGLGRILRRVTWRLIPLLGIAYIVAYLDRINVSFAALQMNQDLHLGAVAYGTGAGIFFLGYVLFEIPSNLILQRVGPRLWIARIMVSWGILSVSMALVRDEWSFYLLRFLLGVAEAGFFPGIILYLTYWFPMRERARIIALLSTATALAGLIGSPLSGMILSLDGWNGWRGWHWLFVLEGLPAIVLGLAVLAVLPEKPEDAKWLNPAERKQLSDALIEEKRALAPQRSHSMKAVLSNKRVWLLSLVYFCMVIGMYGVTLWLPQMLRKLTNAGDLTIGWLNALPFLAAALGMVAIGWHSDFRKERRWHIIFSMMLAALGCVLAASTDKLGLALLAFSLAAIGVWSVMGPFWAWTTSFLDGIAAALGIALINSVGNIGGFLGPYLMGWFKQKTAGYESGLTALACILLAGSLAAFAVQANRNLGRKT